MVTYRTDIFFQLGSPLIIVFQIHSNPFKVYFDSRLRHRGFILRSGHTILDSGHTVHHYGHITLQSGHTILDSGHTVLHIGHTMLQSGHTKPQNGSVSVIKMCPDRSGNLNRQSSLIISCVMRKLGTVT
jgi:hypothetical protein